MDRQRSLKTWYAGSIPAVPLFEVTFMFVDKHWDWKRALPCDIFHQVSLIEYPGWDRQDGQVLYVKLRLQKNKTKSSRDIAIAFDDMAINNFYYRDHTNSGLPFLSNDEIYHSSFWFSRLKDRDRFLELYGEYIASGTV